MMDKYIDKFSQLSTSQLAYMRDVTEIISPDIQALNKNVKVIGRAFTVQGPHIYINACEAIPRGSILIHAQGHRELAVWSGLYAEIHGRSRGLVAAVIDGGIHNRTVTENCDIPTFARFVSPRPAINLATGPIQIPVVCGGVLVSPGDIIVGDEDGVVVVPKRHEEDIYRKIDGFLNGIVLWRKLANQPGVVITKHEAIRELLQFKYDHPHDYWRYYEPWAAKWQDKYDHV